jgi:5'-3' exonuclease
MGDKVDNIPGIPGVGEKTAIQLIKQFDTIENLFLQEERESKKVYKGEESIGRRALRRVLIRSRLSSMYADIRTEMTYNAPPELGDLYTRFEKMWGQIQEEQRIANANELRAIQTAAAKRRRAIRKIKENATWFGAVLFVSLWLISLLLLIRMSKTMSLGYY